MPISSIRLSDRLHQLAHGASAQCHITQSQHTQFPENSSFRVLSSAARLRLVASPLEMNHTIIDVVIGRTKLYVAGLIPLPEQHRDESPAAGAPNGRGKRTL
jgi:hypothetical protein